MGQDYKLIAPEWRYCARAELLAKKKPNFYQRMDKTHAFWFGIFCLLGVIAGARQHDLLSLSIFSAMGGIAFYIAYASMSDLVEGTICRIMIDGIDFGYRVDAGDLEDFLSCRFENRKIEVERTEYWVRTLPAGDYWTKEHRKQKPDSLNVKIKGPLS